MHSLAPENKNNVALPVAIIRFSLFTMTFSWVCNRWEALKKYLLMLVNILLINDVSRGDFIYFIIN